VAQVGADVGVVVAAVVQHDGVGARLAVEVQYADHVVRAPQRRRVQPRDSGTHGERVAAGAAVHAGHGVGVGAVDVEDVVAAAQADVDRFHRAGHGLDAVLDLTACVVNGPRPGRIGQVVAGTEVVVVDADLLVAAQAHAGEGDGAELARDGGGVAAHVQ